MYEEKPHLLIVDDDARLRSLLYKFLTENGFHVSTADEANHAWKLLEKFDFDLAVLDVMMPGESGFDLTKKIRASQNEDLPVLLLTAMGEVDNRIDGLTFGADDYLTKPFDPRELLLRINAILRRTQQEMSSETLYMGDVTFDPTRNQLDRKGSPISLTTAESSLLHFFTNHLGKILSREDLAEALPRKAHARTIDVQVTRLRRKIEDNPKLPRYLQTIRGQGYILKPDRC